MKSFLVIGCGKFGTSIAKSLYDLGNEVMAIDISEKSIEEISEHVTVAVQADIMSDQVLNSLGISNFDVAIVAIGSDLESSVMATLIAKESGIEKVIAKAQSEIHSKILYKIGADKVIFPERDMGLKLAHSLSSDNILDFIQLSPEYNILEVVAIKEWENKSLAELNLGAKYSINVMAIKDKNGIKVSPSGEDMIYKDDILVIIGNVDDIKKIEKRFGG